MLTTYLAPFVPIPSWTSTHVTVLHFSWFSAMTFTVGMFVPFFIYTSYFPCLMTSSTTNGTLKRKKIINMYKFNYFAFKIVYPRQKKFSNKRTIYNYKSTCTCRDDINVRKSQFMISYIQTHKTSSLILFLHRNYFRNYKYTTDLNIDNTNCP